MPERLAHRRRTGARFLTCLHRFRLIGQTARLDRKRKSACHIDRIAAAGNGGIQQHAVKTPFHHLRRLRRQTQACVDNQRRVGQAFAQDFQRISMNCAQTCANRCRPRHQRLTACVEQAAAGNQVFSAIRQHFKAVFNQNFRRFNELEHIGLQSIVIADKFELDPVGIKHFARHLRSSHGFLHTLTACGIGQHRHAHFFQQRPKALPVRFAAATGTAQ